MGRGRCKNAAPQPEWMSRVIKGSLICNKAGFRVVRRVHRYTNGDLFSVSVVKRRRSWTSRPFTSLTNNDLIQQGYHLVEGTIDPLDKLWDSELEKCFDAPYAKDCPIRDWDAIRMKIP